MKKWFLLLLALLMLTALGGCSQNCGPDAYIAPETASEQSATEAVSAKETDAPAPYPVAGGSILEQLPIYSYGGSYVETYEMGATGSYSDAQPGFPTVEDWLDGGQMLVFEDVPGTEAFYGYCHALETSGFSLYAQNALDGNLFATYITGGTAVTVSYLKNAQQLNILAEPLRCLPGRAEENDYEDLGIENKLVLMSCGYVEQKENGMCILYQLCDGSFLIYDSGFGYGYHPGGSRGDTYQDYWENQAHEIYTTLCKLAREAGVNEIVIAGWIFTHPHWDHIGGFIPFAQHYADQVTLETVILNWPNQASFQEMLDPARGVKQKMTHYVDLMQDAIAKFDGVQMVEAHAGQTYYIRDAVVNVLMTWELQTELDWKWTSINEGNSISLITTVDIGGERIVMLGDCGKSCTDAMELLYTADFLKSDILQVAHHGYNGFTRKLNELVAPDVLLWTNDNLHDSALKANFDNIPSNIYHHDKKITLISLPYTGDTESWEREYRFFGEE